MPLARLDIPEACYEEKAVFRERPGPEVLKEIHTFIKETGKPHLWPNHTHTRPPDGSEPVYLDEFHLPSRLVKLKYFAPCPCCTPEHPRFGHGMIAWFPDEGVIRLIGPRCFRTLNKSGHDRALTELRQRKQREADISFLLEHRSRHEETLHILVEARLVAQALDAFRKELRHTVEERLNLKLWETVNKGMKVFQAGTALSSSGALRDITDMVNYGTVWGVEILRPPKRNYVFQLDGAITSLRQALEKDDWEGYIQAVPDGVRHHVAQMISRSIKTGRVLIGEMHELRRFVDQQNINTMRAWGVHPGNPMPLAIERKGSKLRVGPTSSRMLTVDILDDLEIELAPIPMKPLEEMKDE